MGIGADIAKKMPPPAELDDVMSDVPEPGEGMPSEEGEDAAAEASSMEEFASSLKGGSVEEQVAAFKKLTEACTPTKEY